MIEKLKAIPAWAKSRHASSVAVGIGALAYAVTLWLGDSRDVALAVAAAVVFLGVPALNAAGVAHSTQDSDKA